MWTKDESCSEWRSSLLWVEHWLYLYKRQPSYEHNQLLGLTHVERAVQRYCSVKSFEIFKKATLYDFYVALPKHGNFRTVFFMEDCIQIEFVWEEELRVAISMTWCNMGAQPLSLISGAPGIRGQVTDELLPSPVWCTSCLISQPSIRQYYVKLIRRTCCCSPPVHTWKKVNRNVAFLVCWFMIISTNFACRNHTHCTSFDDYNH